MMCACSLLVGCLRVPLGLCGGWMGLLADPCQRVLLLVYPPGYLDATRMPEHLSPPQWVRRWRYLCSQGGAEVGALRVPPMPAGGARAGSWAAQVFVYTVWGTTVVLLIPALAGVPAAPGRWQLSGAGRERGRHCCVSQPRSMPLCLLLQIFTPRWEPGDGGATGAGCTGWGTTPGLQGCPQTSIILDPPLQAVAEGGCSMGPAANLGWGRGQGTQDTSRSEHRPGSARCAPSDPAFQPAAPSECLSRPPRGLGDVAGAAGGAAWPRGTAAVGCPVCIPASPSPNPARSGLLCSGRALTLNLGFHLRAPKCRFLCMSSLCAQTLALLA